MTMSDLQNGSPVSDTPQGTPNTPVNTPQDGFDDVDQANDSADTPDDGVHADGVHENGEPDDRYGDRLERLGGEPAPVITPEEFARLQRAGQVHIDAQGRVRTTRRTDAEAGVSLKKRRAWYSNNG